MKMPPGGLVNLIRRDGCRLWITSEEGRTVYAEGKDFAGAKDRKLGQAVINGNPIPGIYDYWHEPPVMTLPAGSRIKDGQKVLVSYCHSRTILGDSKMCCTAEPRIWDLTRRHMVLVHKASRPASPAVSGGPDSLVPISDPPGAGLSPDAELECRLWLFSSTRPPHGHSADCLAGAPGFFPWCCRRSSGSCSPTTAPATP
jgi:hypothetical protein